MVFVWKIAEALTQLCSIQFAEAPTIFCEEAVLLKHVVLSQCSIPHSSRIQIYESNQKPKSQDHQGPFTFPSKRKEILLQPQKSRNNYIIEQRRKPEITVLCHPVSQPSPSPASRADCSFAVSTCEVTNKSRREIKYETDGGPWKRYRGVWRGWRPERVTARSNSREGS